MVELEDIMTKDLVLTVKKNGLMGRLCHVGMPCGKSVLLSIRCDFACIYIKSSLN